MKNRMSTAVQAAMFALSGLFIVSWVITVGGVSSLQHMCAKSDDNFSDMNRFKVILSSDFVAADDLDDNCKMLFRSALLQ